LTTLRDFCHVSGVAVSNKGRFLLGTVQLRRTPEDGPDLSLETGHCLAKRAIEIDCKEVWRQISNYLDNEVEPGLRASMTSHFKDCAHCSAVLDGTRNVVELVGDGRAFKIPASQRLYKKLNEHVAARQRKRG
jgi:hypothetical protein